MNTDYDLIKKLPVTTNKVDVRLNKESFFSKYSIVSYYGTNKDSRNLAYEQLANIPTLSVAGIKAIYKGLRFPLIKFFILVEKAMESKILTSLRKYDYIRSQIDTLEDYDERLQKRIIASLAINSLGKKGNGKMMYNDGSLLICDDINFNVPNSKKELVCLKIEVNEYMNLVAKTTSFSTPLSYKDLSNHKRCVFKIGSDIGGCLWKGRSIKPVVIRDSNIDDYNLKDLFIHKKRFNDNKNTVPYWPYNKEKYTHGKLFVLWEVLNLVNENFKNIIEISFCDFTVLEYDEYKTAKDMLSFLVDYLNGKSIYFDDPFDTIASKKLIEQFKIEAQSIMGNTLIFAKNEESDSAIIKLCEPEDKEVNQTHYSKSSERNVNGTHALQHIIFHNNEKKDTVDKVKARRILIELLVKDSLIKRVMPKHLSQLIKDWEFYRYKVNDGRMHGASLEVDNNCAINIKEYGLSQNTFGEDFEMFIKENLKFDDVDKIRGHRDYMALKKNDNVYLIIDTDEIPILDAGLLDAGYNEVVNEGETIAMFKRKKSAHNYLRGYIGFHLWKSDGFNGEKNASYSYISGVNRENMQIMQSTKMDKMPRVRRIFILHKNNPEAVECDIREIAAMLKYGFGRWNELMTYPFPFKFLYEYLDDACERVFSKHWKELNRFDFLSL